MAAGSGWRRWSGSRRRSPAAREELFTAWRRFLEALAADAAGGARVRGPALGGRGAARVPRASGRLGARACRCSSSARRGRSSTSSIPSWAGGAANATTINLAAAVGQETAQLVSGLLEQDRPAGARRSRRCSSGRAATRCMRRSSCACSPTAACRRQARRSRRCRTSRAGADRRPPRHAAARSGRACCRTRP